MPPTTGTPGADWSTSGYLVQPQWLEDGGWWGQENRAGWGGDKQEEELMEGW